ncbi:Uncharacterised protein [Klebsiella oxytoca]|nr:hypothetical protein L406_04187 [Enterobacter sp. BWH 37]KDF33493.1 hypothetical protein AE41_04671 [Enterobacter hormaechei]KLW20160.1 hypothetical protein SK49_04329 [Enterobacter sp. BWH63]CAE7644945.1 hypothetical protein AI2760V1_4678 [Enterobacter cloacae]CAI1204432.1 Uncharacterised protein [Serratia grimesii]SAQ10812.1 Uncharacterised protein [Klebsiella oxytoca]SXE36288.1 Uncharacterised protein [Klebsiella variicola]VGE69819.1 Uncharacterised protein [Klebsiella pneumoniae]BBS1
MQLILNTSRGLSTVVSSLSIIYSFVCDIYF